MSGSNNSLAGLYAQPPQQTQQVNPINQLGQITTMVNQANQNKAFQQEFAYKQAAGQILQNSVDPQTGQVDYNKAFMGMAQNPATAWNAPQFLQDGIANQKIQADTAISQLTARQTQLGALTKAAMQLTANGPQGATQQAALGSMAQLIATGVVDRPTAMKYVQTLAQYPDGQPLYQHLKDMAINLQSAGDAATSVIGQVSNIGLNGHVQPVVQSAYAKTSTPVGAPMVQVPSADRVNAPQSGVNPATGAQVTGTAGTMLPLTDADGKPLNNVNGPITTDLGPQANEVLQKYVPALNERVQNAQTALQGFNKMQELATSFKSGAGADTRMKVAAGLQALGAPNYVVDSVAGKNGDSQDAAYAKMQEFMKLQVVNSMQTLRAASGMGVFSTDQYNTFNNALQSVGTDPRALKGITNYMQQLAEMPGQEQQAFQKYQTAVSKGATYTDDSGKKIPYAIGNWPATWNKALVRTGKIKLVTPNMAQLFGQGGGAQAPASNGQ